MLFVSYEFLVFLPLALLGCALLGRIGTRARNLFLVAASYVFYGWWDWRFLSLIAASSLLDYAVGIGLGRARAPAARRLLLAASLAGNLGLLGFFKYFDFFLESLRAAAAALGWTLDAAPLRLVLPVGISFYTFQTLSYSIDVYRGRIRPILDPVAFFAFVGYFPQLVAGPIERAASLLPQFLTIRPVAPAMAADGLRLMLWGAFKKIVVADRLAVFVNAVYAAPSDFAGWPVLLATYFFAFQIYGDFSGYTDIARGVARLMGFELMLNFRRPYFAASIAEFWSRWHISLSTWFRDYVYIPLGGNRVPRWRWRLNLMTVFLVSGLWHGANWTFVVWGALHGAAMLLSSATRAWRDRLADALGMAARPRLRRVTQTLLTFHLVGAGWVFFRAPSLRAALQTFYAMAGPTPARLALPELARGASLAVSLAAVAVLLAVEFAAERRPLRPALAALPAAVRWSAYLAIALAVLNLGTREEIPFIYFQF